MITPESIKKGEHLARHFTSLFHSTLKTSREVCCHHFMDVETQTQGSKKTKATHQKSSRSQGLIPDAKEWFQTSPIPVPDKSTMNQLNEVKWILSWLLTTGQHNTTGHDSHQEKGYLRDTQQVTCPICSEPSPHLVQTENWKSPRRPPHMRSQESGYSHKALPYTVTRYEAALPHKTPFRLQSSTFSTGKRKQ